jgi:endoglucanase
VSAKTLGVVCFVLLGLVLAPSAGAFTPGAWTPLPPMTSARYGAVAATLSDGRVLVAGGIDGSGAATASAEIYDPSTDTWTATAPMASARAFAVAAPLSGDRVLVAGGDVGGSPVSSAEIYDASSGTWSPAPSMQYPRAQASAAALPDGTVWVFGGTAESVDTEIYDPVANSWSISTMGPGSSGSAAAALGNGQVLVGGGNDPSSLGLEPYWGLDSPSGTENWGGWSMPGAPYLASAASLPGWDEVLMAGGSYSTSGPPGTTSANIYDPNSPIYDAWSSTLPMSTARYGAVAATLPSGVLVAGGEGPSGALASAEEFVVPPAGFHLEAGTLQGLAPVLAAGRESSVQIPIIRDVTSGVGEVSYRVWDPTGAGYPAFPPFTGTLVFEPGEDNIYLQVPMTVNGVRVMPASLSVELYNGYPQSVVDPSEESVTIRSPDDPLYARNPANPLGLPATPPAGDPLRGAKFFADYYESLPGRTALLWAAAYPSLAAKVSVIAREPNTERFGAWSGADPAWSVSSYLDRAASEEPGTVPLISSYRLVDGHCGHYADPPAEQLAYHDWITGLAEGIGEHPAVLFLEMDSLITTGCLSPAGVSVRMAELRDAVNVLSSDPHLVVYLDAGAADALHARVAARLLLRAGVSKVQGFFLNSTHFDWTSREIRYGEEISRLTGGKHFVINTAENGQGPLRPRHPAKEGNEVLCNPPDRGLGPLPTADTGYRNVDAFAWIANPGVSGGECRPGAPASGVWWPALALELVAHENFRVR